VPPHSLTDPAGLRISAEDFLAAVSETPAECPMQLPRATGQTVARDLNWFFGATA
jgi:hypothetical protein